jgi:hypothetical protein
MELMMLFDQKQLDEGSDGEQNERFRDLDNNVPLSA